MSHIHYLNTDLIIEASSDLSPIADAFGEDVNVMYTGEWGDVYRAAFEIAGTHAGGCDSRPLVTDGPAHKPYCDKTKT